MYKNGALDDNTFKRIVKKAVHIHTRFAKVYRYIYSTLAILTSPKQGRYAAANVVDSTNRVLNICLYAYRKCILIPHLSITAMYILVHICIKAKL